MSSTLFPGDVLGVPEVQLLFGRSRDWVYRAVANGDLPATRVAGTIFFLRSDLEALLKSSLNGGSE